jgi:hypothetical protein
MVVVGAKRLSEATVRPMPAGAQLSGLAARKRYEVDVFGALAASE